MNKPAFKIQELDILTELSETSFSGQRELAETTGHSLGVVNRSIKALKAAGYLDEQTDLTDKARALLRDRKPRNAVILAAGVGMRMVPINLMAPKALLEVKGERLIERTIRQLHEAGITDITIVVGFLKEAFEYLIDAYGVDLVVNPEYAQKNNISSLRLVLDRIGNTYIIPCDTWSEENPFHARELYSWYMVADRPHEESVVRVNRKKELISTQGKEPGNRMIGIAYLLEEEAGYVKKQIKQFSEEERYANTFWEIALYKQDRMIVPARVVSSEKVVEINTYEQLRELDSESNQLKSEAIHTITEALGCREKDINEIEVLKKGMTNRSFVFSVWGQRYIMRIPGEGTDHLINRKQEAEVFRTISGLGLCDDPVYINPENGYKITRYLEHVRVCDTNRKEDLVRCMHTLRAFHDLHLRVPHSFDLFGQIGFYETLWEGNPSVYRDYACVKEQVFRLKGFIDSQEKEWTLTHIDAVCDNFLFYKPEDEEEERLQLTDWEYAGMQDPHVDIAMFCIYSLFDKKQCDALIDLYFSGSCEDSVRAKIYCYIAACGLLWSNWCEYKRQLGVEFGEYSLRQYRYAKDFYKYAMQLIEPEK
ncbi:MAG: NTP transferase domain-containing protein [Eubacterium sp.]|nr:NTP transferase domain-containing protein [Eubacterium sp.]